MIWTNTVIIIQISLFQLQKQEIRSVSQKKCYKGFSMIWQSDVDFETTWSLFELGLKIIKVTILDSGKSG